VQVGDQHPQQAQQAEDQERVIDPQSAAHIIGHANACSPERMFECKNGRRHNRITALVLLGLMLAATGCLPDPRLARTGELLDQLSSARGMLDEQPPRVQDGCGLVGTTSTRLYGEPGLVDVRMAWPELREAAYALQAVCGQDILLAQPSTGSPAVLAAHARWQQGIQREMGVACDHLRAAAAALNRPLPC
jgi:hypothetical protein